MWRLKTEVPRSGWYRLTGEPSEAQIGTVPKMHVRDEAGVFLESALREIEWPGRDDGVLGWLDVGDIDASHVRHANTIPALAR